MLTRASWIPSHLKNRFSRTLVRSPYPIKETSRRVHEISISINTIVLYHRSRSILKHISLAAIHATIKMPSFSRLIRFEATDGRPYFADLGVETNMPTQGSQLKGFETFEDVGLDKDGKDVTIGKVVLLDTRNCRMRLTKMCSAAASGASPIHKPSHLLRRVKL